MRGRLLWAMSRRALLTTLLFCAGAVCAGRAEAAWPWRGELGGDVDIAVLAEAGIAWRAELITEGVVLTASAPGVVVEVLATPRGMHFDKWGWQVRRGEIDLGVWWPQLRALLGEGASGWSASGRLTVAGEGAWSAGDDLTGELRVALRDGWARSDALDLEVGGVELDVKTRDLASGALAAGQALRIGKVLTAGAEMRDIEVDFGLTAQQELMVARMEAVLLGGRVQLRPFQLALNDPKVSAAAELDGVDLTEMAKLVPWAVSSAQGRLRGRIELDWDLQRGLLVRDGGLDIVRVDGARFQLAPSPGMLTGGMPRRFGLFPRSWPLVGAMSITNPAYSPLRQIELGREGLSIETLQVSFWPDGPGQGRTATVHVVGRPTGGKLVKEVVIDLNFHGPWTDFLAFGLNQEASYGFRVE